ncbi:MAG: arginine--tRNA ligase, partial [Planctomycetes bacterium]|nr:arginine--tRNA ligase [Planctomycetota bacterium]
MNILHELRSRFRTVLQTLGADPELASLVKPVQDARHGDYQANCAMPLAKQRGGNGREIATQIVAQLSIGDLCDPPEIAGGGFINLRLKPDWLTAQINSLVADERLGVNPAAPPRRIVVDYSSPNVAKPMHVGHIRSTVIGDAIYRILKFLGHNVTSDNHIGDWGTQFGMIIYGYKNFLNREALERNIVAELARLYRLVNQLSDYHEAIADLPRLTAELAAARQRQQQATEQPVPADKKEQEARKKALKKLAADVDELAGQVKSATGKKEDVESRPELAALAQAHPRIAVAAREETAKLHMGDAENLALWNQFMPACLAAINAMYQRLGIRFDTTLGESYFQPFLGGVVDSLEQKGIAQVSDGAMCVFIPGVDAPFIVRKSDGAYTYATTDLATIQYRAETLAADTMLYVVDSRQSDHFRLLFETARRWGFDQVDFRHISFGTILGENKLPIKTRSGDSVGLESLLDEAVVEARKIVDAND